MALYVSRMWQCEVQQFEPSLRNALKEIPSPHSNTDVLSCYCFTLLILSICQPFENRLSFQDSNTNHMAKIRALKCVLSA